MIQCPTCGVQNSDDTRFCSGCGNTVTGQPSTAPAPSKNKGSMKIVFIVIGALALGCVLCGALGGVQYYMNPEKYDTPKPAANTNGNKTPVPAGTTPVNATNVANTANANKPAEAPKDTVAPIKWNDVDRIYNVRSNSTDMQKEALWKDFKGKRVSWTGTVTEVSEGPLGGLYLNIKMNADTLTSDIRLTLKDDQKQKAMSMTKGTKVAFAGTLNNYGGAVLPMTMDDGEIK